MNVLFITDKLITGGAETYFCKLENELQHPDLTLYTAAGYGDLYGNLKQKERFTILSKKNHFRNIKRLSKKVVACDIHMIHANSLRMLFYAILIKKLIRREIKIVYTKHNLTLLDGKYKLILSKILNGYVDRVITVSEYERNNLVLSGVRESLITTIYNGVDLKQFTFSHKVKPAVKKIGILARLSSEKNHDLFLKIAYELEKNYPDSFEFYIGGNGPEQLSILQKIKELGLSKKVHCLGEIKHPEQFIREMDVLLLTSHREVFPMVILEAMAVGTPMIAIDKGGINEAIIDEQTGFLIPSHSEKEFSEKVLLLYFNQQLYKQMAEASRQTVQSRFTLHHMIQSTLQVYLNLHIQNG